MNKLRNSEIIRYIMTGGLTTAVNYALFFLLNTVSVNYLAANSIAWLGAVIFAFCANRRVVFQSRGRKSREFARFFSLRLLTLLLENLLLFLFVDCIGLGKGTAKIAVSGITVLLNYFACKYSVFSEGGVSHE